jgi:hypothetical protein
VENNSVPEATDAVITGIGGVVGASAAQLSAIPETRGSAVDGPSVAANRHHQSFREIVNAP